MSRYTKELSIAKECLFWASEAAKKVFGKINAIQKSDLSPVTIADYAVQAIINHHLHYHFPNDPIVAEEDSKKLMEQPELLSQVTKLINSVISKPMSEKEVCDSIGLGDYNGGSKGRFWTLDPIDGTKGFLRGGQYAICLALIQQGKVDFGIMSCPNLPIANSSSVGCLFYAEKGFGAFMSSFHESKMLKLPSTLSTIRFCESVESGHSSHELSQLIAKKLDITESPVRMDSQCKYGIVAAGEAQIYMRIARNQNYEENIWDHAAGSLIVEEAGGKVTDMNGALLDFSAGRTLKHNSGILAAHSSIHSKVVDAYTVLKR